MESQEDFLEDAEKELEGISEQAGNRIRELGALIYSRKQLEDKGRLLGHFKSGRFLRTYIDVYERAIIGEAEIRHSCGHENIDRGMIRIKEAVVERGTLFLAMSDGKVYRIRALKNAEEAAYLINSRIPRSQ